MKKGADSTGKVMHM